MSCTVSTRRNLLKIFSGFLALVAASPLLALPPISVNVVLEKAVPIVDDAYIYEKIVGDSFGDPVRANLALDLFLRNDESFPVTIDRVTLDFESPDIASIVLDSGLLMWCQGVQTTAMTGATGLIMPAGAKCRLGLTPNPILTLPAPGELTISVAYAGILTQTLVPQRELRSYRNSTPTGAYRLPVKAEDLGSGHYWFGRPALSGERHRFKSRTENSEVFAYDMSVRRRDVWNSSTEPGESDPAESNTEFLCWGHPVYAMADGEVLGFAFSNADNKPGEEIPNTAQANFFSIKHGDEIAWYGHLRKDSLNQHLRAIGAVVKQGQKLGECGNSGQSGGVPHLHVEVARNGDPMPLQFNDAFLLEQSAFGPGPLGNLAWNAFKGAGLSASEAAIWPSGLRRRGSALDVAITDVAIVAPSLNRTLTAARTLAGNLRVSSWSTENTGEAVLLDTEIDGGVAKVALAVPSGSGDGAVAMITAGGLLKLSGFDLSGNTLSRRVDHVSNSAKDVAAASSPFPDGVVTAIRSSTDTLKVIAWTVDPGGATIVRHGSAGGGVIGEVAVTRTGSFPGVVTAVRNSNGKLELLTFRVSANGAVTREDEFEDFAADRISVTRLGLRPDGEDLVVTASRNASGDLELISWSIDGDGDIVRLQRLSLGGIGEVSAARSSASHLLTAISNQDGNYELIAWRVDEDGNFTRRTETVGGPATAIAQEGTKTTGGMTLAVSAMADDAGLLKLIVHQVQLTD